MTGEDGDLAGKIDWRAIRYGISQRLTELDDATARARRAYSALAEQTEGQELDSPRQWPIYGALQTDTHRLVEEFIQARDSLAQLLDHHENEPQTPTNPVT